MDDKNNVIKQDQTRNQSAGASTNLSMKMDIFSTFVPTCKQPCDAASAPNAFAMAAQNPFETQLAANPFTVNVTGKEFIPNADITRFPLTMNSTFTPSTNSGNTSEEPMTLPAKFSTKIAADKFKTEMCKNWIENNECRYGRKCQYAHGKDELAHFRSAIPDDKHRTKNCRTFYKEKACMYGSRCMFRHEHRHYNQIMRHYYACKMNTIESLFANSQD